MKQLVFAIITAIIGVLNANAQVLTKETVNNLFDKMAYQSNSDFVFNAERTDSDITTMFVYQKNFDRKGTMTLKPHLKYDYSYDADGTLTSHITYHWLEGQNDWVCSGRHDYTLDGGIYFAEYSRYNHAAQRFDEPVDKMVYLLMPFDAVNCVSYYHRNNPSAHYHLVSEAVVTDPTELLASK